MSHKIVPVLFWLHLWQVLTYLENSFTVGGRMKFSQTLRTNFHHTLNMSLHYLGKLEVLICRRYRKNEKMLTFYVHQF